MIKHELYCCQKVVLSVKHRIDMLLGPSWYSLWQNMQHFAVELYKHTIQNWPLLPGPTTAKPQHLCVQQKTKINSKFTLVSEQPWSTLCFASMYLHFFAAVFAIIIFSAI